MTTFDLKTMFETIEGKLSLTNEQGDITVTAGDAGTWTFTVINQGSDLLPGAVFRLFITDIQMAGKPQNQHPRRRDYMTLTTEGSAEVEWKLGVIGYKEICQWKIKSGIWKSGESITIRLGDRSGGSAGSEVFWTTTVGTVSVEWKDNDASSFIKTGAVNRIYNKADSRPALFRLLGPTIAKIGTPFRLHLGVFDRNGNVAEDYQGTVQFKDISHSCIKGLPDSFTFGQEDRGNKVFEQIVIEKEGVFRIGLQYEEADAQLSVNPIVVQEKPEEYIYWGDLHCHSWGDSTMLLMHNRTEKVDPLSRHKQAFEIGRFDFSAPGPMSYPRENREGIWNAHLNAVRQMEIEKKHEYIPFLSYEAHPSDNVGDRNVIFKQLDEPIPPDYAIPMKELEEKYGKRDDCILQVHIGGQTPKWDLYKPQRERMIEVASGFGNAEWLLRKALRLGYRPAVVGCSDLHLGLLGGPKAVETFRGRFGPELKVRDSGFGQGPLTAASAPELTRESIWESYTNRKTYGTNGERIYLKFECNGIQSGGEVNIANHYSVKVVCHGTKKIHRIDLISGEREIKVITPDGLDWEGSLNIQNHELPENWLYCRVIQEDGSCAWSSPIWLHERQHDSGSGLITPVANESAALAEKYAEDVKAYIELEEDASLFHNIHPVGMRRETLAECAVFHCEYGRTHRKMTIRWYFSYPIPKIRLDWGHSEEGLQDCEAKGYYK